MAERYPEKRISWPIRSGIREIVRFGNTVKRNFNGIVSAIKLDLSNSAAESINNKIKTALKRSCGLKSDEYRDTMIFLVAGKLELSILPSK